MSEQRTSLHAIIFLGLAGVAIMVIFMMVSMTGLEQSAAGTRARLALAVSGEYKFENVGVDFLDAPGMKVMHVHYVTRKDLDFDSAREEAEMRDVAQFTYQESLRLRDEVLYEVRRVTVKRSERRGTGCFQSSYEGEFKLDLPKRERPGERLK